MGTIESYVTSDLMNGRYHKVLTFIVKRMEETHEDCDVYVFNNLKAVREKMLEDYEGKHVRGSFNQEYKNKYLCSFEREKDK